MKPDTFTITTFWVDWAMMPLMLGAAWLTLRWGLADWRKASQLEARGEILPGWAVFLSLATSAVGFVLLGLSVLVKEPYWEHRGLWAGQMLLLTGCFIGAVLALLGFLRGGSEFGIAAVSSATGLLLMSVLLVLPALFVNSPPTQYTLAACLWFGLLMVCAGCLTAGMLLGFPYNYARFPLGIAGIYAFGIGLMEIGFKRPGFSHLLYVWDFRLGLDYVYAGPESTAWQIAGLAKTLLAVGAVTISAIGSRRRGRRIAPARGEEASDGGA
jgi:O-antigen/teichoic acid export membrane protein